MQPGTVARRPRRPRNRRNSGYVTGVLADTEPGCRRRALRRRSGDDQDACRRGRDRRCPGAPAAGRAVPALGRAADRPGRVVRDRPRHLPARRPPGRPAAAHRLGHRPGAHRGEVAAQARAAAALALPVQLARGRPAEGYPFGWSVYEWLPGENANGTIGDLEQAAVDLAGFVRALRRVDTTGAHPGTRMAGAGHLPSTTSMSAARSPATRPATCSPPGTCSPGPAGPGSGTSSRSTTPPGCGVAAGPSSRRWSPCPTTGTPTPAWSVRPPTPSPRCSPTGPRTSGAACCAGPCPLARGR